MKKEHLINVIRWLQSLELLLKLHQQIPVCSKLLLKVRFLYALKANNDVCSRDK